MTFNVIVCINFKYIVLCHQFNWIVTFHLFYNGALQKSSTIRAVFGLMLIVAYLFLISYFSLNVLSGYFLFLFSSNVPAFVLCLQIILMIYKFLALAWPAQSVVERKCCPSEWRCTHLPFSPLTLAHKYQTCNLHLFIGFSCFTIRLFASSHYFTIWLLTLFTYI